MSRFPALRCFRLAAIAAILAIYAPDARAQGGVARATADPSRVRLIADPQILVFAPGNWGEAHLVAKPDLSPWRRNRIMELGCNGSVFRLADPEYDFQATSPDAEETSPPNYWARLRRILSTQGASVSATDFRITRPLLDEIASDGSAGTGEFCRRMGGAIDGLPAPMISFAPEIPAEKASPLRDALRVTAPRALLGCFLENATPAGWDFVIVRPESVSSGLSGQSLVSHARSKAGGIPVFVQVPQPDFYSELFWVTAGAAGLYHGELPPVGTPAHEHAWMNLRAVATICGILTPGNVVRMPDLQVPGTEAAFGVPGRSFCLLLKPGASVDALFPDLPDRPEALGMWYNPLNDQHIILPRVQSPRGIPSRLMAPSGDRWIYCHFPLPKATDAETTMGAVVPLDGEEPDE